MTIARLTAYLGLAGAAAAFRAGADEVNYWPVSVRQLDPAGLTQSWAGAGPLLFSKPFPAPEVGQASGFRPFYVKLETPENTKSDYLYPLYFYRKYPGSYKWSILELINGEGITDGVTVGGGPKDRHFDIWPVYFSHETGDPVDTYHALFPIYGTMKYRLGFDRLSWAPFPLFVQTEKRHTETTYVVFPVIRFTHGASNGFGIWPLFGMTKGPGPARNNFFLWPLIWDNTVLPGPNEPEGTAPGTEFGFLPFYTREASPGYESVDFAGPFFGYTERTSPYKYSEQRYFWPFLVQGKGDDRLLNRWGPFYTHSYSKGTDSTWVIWPFWHRKTWVDDDIAQSKTQFFYFLYWSLVQHSVTRPRIAPAYKRHIWPLVSIWDNGAGSRQVEAPSLLEVFFPDNPDMRETWTPLFTLYKYDHRPTGESRNSLLWDAVTWRRDASGSLSEFHLGPLLGMRRGAGGPDWSILGFDFGSKPGKGGQANR